jgi:hypothetical protein
MNSVMKDWNRVKAGLNPAVRKPKHKCLTRKDKAAMILGFSSVCEGLFTHADVATVAGRKPEVYRDLPDVLRPGGWPRSSPKWPEPF